MKRFLSVCAVFCLLLAAAPIVSAQSNQLLQGTQLRLVLQHSLSSTVARSGDPFTATVAEPVYMGGLLVLPAGAVVTGEVGNVERAKRFSLFRGGAMMMLHFRSIVIDGREVPVTMSILGIYDSATQGSGNARKDLRTVEGTLIEPKRDIKTDVGIAGLSTAGGTVIGTIFSHTLRGLTLGIVGGAAYVVARRGKEVELPAQTAFLVRTDSTVTLPVAAATATPYVTAQR